METLFNIDTIFFTIIGYPMSYIEFIGTITYLWSVWLIGRRNMLTWPVGIVSVLLYMSLFYQVQLYSDALEQIYYIGASLYGWWFWSKNPKKQDDLVSVAFGSRASIIGWAAVTLVFSGVLTGIMQNIHLWLPTLFLEAASYVFLDALTTVMSFVAMWLMVRKQIESWLYWIIVDVIGIWLYFVKDVKFIALLYVMLLVLACRGFWRWRDAQRGDNVTVDVRVSA
jgi:nicotinamide mononucleotide transporter